MLALTFGFTLLVTEVSIWRKTKQIPLTAYGVLNKKRKNLGIVTCVLIGWILKPKTIIDEVEKTGKKMGRKALYRVMIKYIAPAMLAVLFVKSIGVF